MEIDDLQEDGQYKVIVMDKHTGIIMMVTYDDVNKPSPYHTQLRIKAASRGVNMLNRVLEDLREEV